MSSTPPLGGGGGAASDSKAEVIARADIAGEEEEVCVAVDVAATPDAGRDSDGDADGEGNSDLAGTLLSSAQPSKRPSKLMQLIQGKRTSVSVSGAATQHSATERVKKQKRDRSGRRRRQMLRKRYTNKVHAYAVPVHSYFATQPATTGGGGGSAWMRRGNQEEEEVGGDSHRHRCHRYPPRRLAGRLIEQQRYTLPRCPPYRIPLYDQAAFKYIFPNLFTNARRKNKLEIMQIVFLCQMFILAIFNIIMTVVNVFFNDPVGSILPWAKVLSTVIFSLEFAIVGLLFIFMLFTVTHAAVVNRRGRAEDWERYCRSQEAKKKGVEDTKTYTYAMYRRKNGLVIGTTELAQDVATLITLIGTFSVLRIVGFASPSFAFRRIVPIFQNATRVADVLKGILFLFMWICACLLAFLILIAKVTQIDFAFTLSISDWEITNYVQLAGLLFNLARVDDSYYKETSVLLDAVHKHYSPPGQVREYISTWAVPHMPPVTAAAAAATTTRREERDVSALERVEREVLHTIATMLYAANPNGLARGATDGSGAATTTAATSNPAMGPSQRASDAPSLLTRTMRALNVPPFMYFTYFDVIYDYHFTSYRRLDEQKRRNAKRAKAGGAAAAVGGQGQPGYSGDADDNEEDGDSDDIPPPLLVPVRSHVYNFFNYLSFIFEIDNVQLRRYLQMIHSPLPFYRVGRESFASAFVEKDIVGMDMALWRSDPTLRATQRYAYAQPDQFDIAYVCDDQRAVWDSEYGEWAHWRERRTAMRMAQRVVNRVQDKKDG